MIILTVSDLGKHFGQRWIFRNICFEQEGGVLGIAGLNGSGKSTLMRCLSGLHAPDTGTVKWSDDGTDFFRADLRAASGYAAPYVQLYGELTCSENLDFILRSRGVKNGEDEVRAMLSRAGIEAKEHALYKSLSSGQQQRCKLIAAILHHPKVLFLDEPGTNLDTRGLDLVTNMVNERRVNGLTIIASNDSRELDLCDTVYTIPSS